MRRRDFFGASVLVTLLIGFQMSPSWSQESVASPSVSDSTSPVTAALTPFVESGEMPGFVTIVATKDRVLDTTVLGYADIEKNNLCVKIRSFGLRR